MFPPNLLADLAPFGSGFDHGGAPVGAMGDSPDQPLVLERINQLGDVAGRDVEPRTSSLMIIGPFTCSMPINLSRA